jgi:hypothetical protein
VTETVVHTNTSVRERERERDSTYRNRRHEVNEPKNDYLTEMCSGSEAGSCLRRIDFCMTQVQA